jgi:hypothetical protein
MASICHDLRWSIFLSTAPDSLTKIQSLSTRSGTTFLRSLLLSRTARGADEWGELRQIGALFHEIMLAFVNITLEEK